MTKRLTIVVAYSLWIVVVGYVHNRFAYQVDQFYVAARTALTTGTFGSRDFDSRGLPASFSIRQGGRFISPYYVVHYGKIYSQAVDKRRTPFLWGQDSSFAYWNYPPPAELITEKSFRNSVDWVMDNLRILRGKVHLPYKFDWDYAGVLNGKMTAPWWSGLTDSGAMELLLRAYDSTGDEIYLAAADSIYASVISPVAQGGSMILWNGEPWIEEYVQFGTPEDLSPRVLNGMVYATQSIAAYEKFRGITEPISPDLVRSLENHINSFDLDGWSSYDAIGNAANLKYHRVNFVLAERMYEMTGRPVFPRYAEKWRTANENAGILWLWHSSWGVGQLMFVFCLTLLIAMPAVAVSALRRLKRA